MFKLVKKQKQHPITLRQHYNRCNKILIKRRAGGFGDILMHRMMFQDFAETGLDIHFGCPAKFLEMAKNHPFATAHDLNEINERDYGAVFDTTTACRVYESKHAPCEKHRSDIWAESCGIELKKHKMFIQTNPEYKKTLKQEILKINPQNKKIIVLATSSTNDEFGIAKSLTDQQITEIVENLKKEYFLIAIHDSNQEVFKNLGITQLISIPIPYWIALVDLSDLIISIDTGTFHLAGGLKKNLIGVFTFTDGMTYGKYYKFQLVQKHRKNNNWDCGPCFLMHLCPKEKKSPQKPCLTEIDISEIIRLAKLKLSESDQIVAAT
jgi:ADP-heptose:LPS heptosyltransferase